MIAVVGHPLAALVDGVHRPAGTAALAALAAAAAGSDVQLVGKTGDDPAGDEVVLALAAGAVGHVALLREAARATPVIVPRDPDTHLDDDDAHATPIEPADASLRPSLEAADVELGLRYLTDFRVVLVAEPSSDAIVGVAAEAAAYASAQLILVTNAEPAPAVEALMLAAPADAADEGFATLVGTIAAAIDGGASPADAISEATRRVGAVRTG